MHLWSLWNELGWWIPCLIPVLRQVILDGPDLESAQRDQRRLSLQSAYKRLPLAGRSLLHLAHVLCHFEDLRKPTRILPPPCFTQLSLGMAQCEEN